MPIDASKQLLIEKLDQVIADIQKGGNPESNSSKNLQLLFDLLNTLKITLSNASDYHHFPLIFALIKTIQFNISFNLSENSRSALLDLEKLIIDIIKINLYTDSLDYSKKLIKEKKDENDILLRKSSPEHYETFSLLSAVNKALDTSLRLLVSIEQEQKLDYHLQCLILKRNLIEVCAENPLLAIYFEKFKFLLDACRIIKQAITEAQNLLESNIEEKTKKELTQKIQILEDSLKDYNNQIDSLEQSAPSKSEGYRSWMMISLLNEYGNETHQREIGRSFQQLKKERPESAKPTLVELAIDYVIRNEEKLKQRIKLPIDLQEKLRLR